MTNADLQQKRLVAAAIDAGIGVGLLLIVNLVAGFATFIAQWLSGLLFMLGYAVLLAYVLLRDVVGGDRSIGKKVQQIRVVNTYGAAITLVDSAKRNAIFAVGFLAMVVWGFFQMIPVLRCLSAPLAILGGVATLAAVVVEVLKVLQDPQGVRVGDQFANTRVVE